MASSLARSAACFLACALAACGPIGATSLIDDAEVALARAHAADGEKLAPYETTLADLYLIKAREQQGHARYADAKDLAVDCIQEANLAAKKAAERRSAPPAAPAGPAAAASPASVAPPRPAPLVVPLPAPPAAPGPAAAVAPGAAAVPAPPKQGAAPPVDPELPALVPANPKPRAGSPAPEPGAAVRSPAPPVSAAPERKLAPDGGQ